MSAEFPTSALGDLILHQKGFPFKSQDYVDSGVPVIRVSNFTQDSISIKDIKFVDDSIAKQNGKVKLREDDIIIATVGSWPNNPASIVGKTVRVPKQLNNALMNQNSVILRSKSGDKVDQKFLFFALKTKAFSDFLVSNAQGSANQASITLSDIFSYEVEWPTPDVRKSIVAVIDSLSEKIELNRQTNQTLEQIAQALFKSWFVDFEPTRAKIAAKEAGAAPEEIERAAMCAISGKTPDQLAQLPPETQQNLKITAALFPDALVDSELGEVPEGWEIGCLGDQIDFATGFTFKSEDFTSDGIRLARGDNVKEGAFQWGDKTRYWAEVTPDLEKYLLRSGDILIGMDGSKVGKNWVRVSKSDLPCLLVQRVARLRPNGKIGSSMLEILIGGESFKSYVENVKTGTTIPHISGKQIKDLPIIRPDDEGKLFSEFESVLKNLASKRECHLEESLGLTELRDILLPKLLSGEISLIDVHEEFK